MPDYFPAIKDLGQLVVLVWVIWWRLGAVNETIERTVGHLREVFDQRQAFIEAQMKKAEHEQAELRDQVMQLRLQQAGATTRRAHA